MFEETQTFWKDLTRKEQTDPAAYNAALNRPLETRRQALESARRSWGSHSLSPHAQELLEDLEARLHLRYGAAQARVLKSDISFPTNRTTCFPAGEGSITFDRNTSSVTFETGENGRVVDRARSSPTGAALFNRLATVKRTRGTGGIFKGNDELNREGGTATIRSPPPTPSAQRRNPSTARSTPTPKATVSPGPS